MGICALCFLAVLCSLRFDLVFSATVDAGVDYKSATLPREQRNALIIVVDDGGFETLVYGNTKCKTPNLDAFSKKAVVFKNAYTSVSSCSPSRSAILTGLPQHENGMYGLHGRIMNFQSFDAVQSLPWILNQTGQIWYGIVGKKHVGPDYVYPFPFAYTEENYNMEQVGRNITLMNHFFRKFLSQADGRPFLFYFGFHDVHRANFGSKYGPFYEKFGDGTPGMGKIPDWHPVNYSIDDVAVPFFVQDTPEARADIAAQYRAISRMDQGVGLFLQTLKEFGYENNTLVMYTADNGIPFPNAKTNLYDPGMAEPMIVSNPLSRHRWGQESEAMVSTTDIMPTVLDWFGLPSPNYALFGPNRVTLQGKSILPILEKEPQTGWDTVFSSHNLHEVTMYYPMRVMRSKQYKLIHNLNFKMPYPIAGDIFTSPTFQDLLNRTLSGEKTNWFKTFDQYYYRDQWELYDAVADPYETKNLASNPSYQSVLTEMQKELNQWQNATNDPWICLPAGDLVSPSRGHQYCQTMDNGV